MPKLKFKPSGGIYDGPIEVELTCGDTVEASIYYTTDGSTPSSASRRYTGKITVSTVAVIRAVAYVNGRKTKVVTNSYFSDRVYSLPVISVATDTANLWNYSRGIYVKGCCADTVQPYLGANYHRDWERPANIEMYEPDGEKCFNQMAGIKIFGGFSRMLPQKSLAVIARKEYGKNNFKYPIFPERHNKKYKSFVIRNAGGDFNIAHLRDAFMTQLAKPTGVAIQAYRPAIVFINGKYWGIQNLREKINEHYLEQNYCVDKDNVDILRHNGSARHGSSKNYKKLLAYLRSHDMSKDETIEELSTFMDIEDYIRYNIAEVYSDNRDAGGNIRYWRERNDSAKWRWVLYDLDLGLGNSQPLGYKKNTLKKFTSVNNEVWPDPPWSTFIIRSLLQNKKVEQQYINTFADHLNTVYHPDTAMRLLENMQMAIREEMPYHLKRWNSSMKAWEINLNVVRKFVKLRPFYLRKFIMEKFALSDTATVNIKYPQQEMADVKFNSLEIKRDYSGIYFVDVPVTIEVKPHHNYEFKGWKGRKEKTQKLTVKPEDGLVLEPILEPKPLSRFNDSLIFNEIAYYQPDADTSEDWVELYNHSSKEVDLSGWGFTKSSYKKRFILPNGTTIKPGQFLILSRRKGNYATTYNTDTIEVLGDFDFGLAKEGEHIELYDNEGLIVDSLTYFGIGEDDRESLFTISLMHPDSSRSNMLSWNNEDPGPGRISMAYANHLKMEADKRYWTKVYYVGGGSFFFILAVGLLSFRYFKNRKNRQ